MVSRPSIILRTNTSRARDIENLDKILFSHAQEQIDIRVARTYFQVAKARPPINAIGT